MDSSKYTQKCLNKLDSEQFVNATIQLNVLKIIYPTRYSPWKFYDNAWIHQLLKNGKYKRSTINTNSIYIGAASYHLLNCLTKMLSLLSYSEYTVKKTRTNSLNNLKISVHLILWNCYRLVFHQCSWMYLLTIQWI